MKNCILLIGCFGIFFLFSFESKRKNKICYQVSGFVIDKTDINSKEDSIQLTLCIHLNSKKYYNAYWLLENGSEIHAKMRVHYEKLVDDSFRLSCFNAYREGNSISYWFKNTRAEEFVYSTLEQPIVRSSIGSNKYKFTYSYNLEDSLLINSHFEAIMLDMKNNSEK